MQIMHNAHICPSQIYEDCPAFLQPCLYKADYRRYQFFLDFVIQSKKAIWDVWECKKKDHESLVADLLRSVCWQR